ncbi:MAG: hypothetical protein ACE14V_04670 [bacterium]
MKKTIISILVLIVIGIAFYFGYYKSQHKTGIGSHVELRTFTTNQSIKLEYQPNPTTQSGFTISGNNSTLKLEGDLHLEGLINNLFLNDKTVSWSSYMVEISPEVGKRLYHINLSFPAQEPALNIIETIGKELGFSTLVSETTLPFYRAMRNDKPMMFTVSRQSNSTRSSVNADGLYQFKNCRMDIIFKQYKTYGIYIEDATGVTDKFDGEIQLTKDNPEAMKIELKTKAGINLIPFEKTIRLIKIY